MLFTRSHTTTTPSPRIPPVLEGVGPDRGTVCSLTETRVTAGVSGFIAEVRVEQAYVNPYDRNLQTLYTFPLPHDGAVTAFEFQVDGKVVHGVVRERGEARASFEQARGEGRHAGLVEQERPNVFKLELANVPARATVKATLTYLEALPYRSGEFELRFPTVVAPRYTPRGGQPEPVTTPMPVPASSAANPGATVPHGTAGHTFAIDVSVDAGMPVESWRCATHGLEALPASVGQLRLKLAAGTDLADRDLVLTYKVGGEGIRLGLVTYRPDPVQDGTFYLFAVPPADVGSQDVRGKELIFLLDRSGSMQGPKMTQARDALRGCLRALNPADAFSIYAFDTECEAFSPVPVPFVQAQLEAAEKWLARVGARGGTEILPGLAQALALPADAARQRVVVLITDGQVANESQLLAHVRQSLGAARLFTVGVDTAVNTYLLSKLAQMGRGCAQFVLPTGDIEGTISALSQRFGSPLLTDPVADFGTVRVSELAPHPLPDVMAGQVVVVTGRFRGQGKTEVTFSGQGPGKLLEHRVEVEFPREDRANPLVEKIWARLMIDRHEDNLLDDPHAPTLKQKIVALSVEHGLLSSLTSFVAVDERDGDPKKAREAVTQVIAQEMPAQWEMRQDFAGLPPLGAFGGSGAAPSPAAPGYQSRLAPASSPRAASTIAKCESAPSPVQLDCLTGDPDDAGPGGAMRTRTTLVRSSGNTATGSSRMRYHQSRPVCAFRTTAASPEKLKVYTPSPATGCPLTSTSTPSIKRSICSCNSQV